MKFNKKNIIIKVLIGGVILSALLTLLLIIFAPSQLIIYTTMIFLGFSLGVVAHISPYRLYEKSSNTRTKKTWKAHNKKNKSKSKGKVILFPGSKDQSTGG